MPFRDTATLPDPRPTETPRDPLSDLFQRLAPGTWALHSSVATEDRRAALKEEAAAVTQLAGKPDDLPSEAHAMRELRADAQAELLRSMIAACDELLAGLAESEMAFLADATAAEQSAEEAAEFVTETLSKIGITAESGAGFPGDPSRNQPAARRTFDRFVAMSPPVREIVLRFFCK